MSNKTRSVLYIGVTNDLYRRYVEHKQGLVKGFTQKYKCHHLMYYEEFKDINEAIEREKVLKGWVRVKKDKLIATVNPKKQDLAELVGWVLSCHTERSEVSLLCADLDSSLRSE